MNNDKLAEFLEEHKRNCENFNDEGNYDPNPYWLADEIVEFLNLQNVSNNEVAVCCETCANFISSTKLCNKTCIEYSKWRKAN